MPGPELPGPTSAGKDAAPGVIESDNAPGSPGFCSVTLGTTDSFPAKKVSYNHPPAKSPATCPRKLPAAPRKGLKRPAPATDPTVAPRAPNIAEPTDLSAALPIGSLKI